MLWLKIRCDKSNTSHWVNVGQASEIIFDEETAQAHVKMDGETHVFEGEHYWFISGWLATHESKNFPAGGGAPQSGNHGT